MVLNLSMTALLRIFVIYLQFTVHGIWVLTCYTTTPFSFDIPHIKPLIIRNAFQLHHIFDTLHSITAFIITFLIFGAIGDTPY